MINIASNTVFINNGESDFLITLGALNLTPNTANVQIVISPVVYNTSTNNTSLSLQIGNFNTNNYVSNLYFQNVLSTLATTNNLVQDFNIINTKLTDLDNGIF